MIRRATEDDRASVLSLMEALVCSLIQHGGNIRPGAKTTRWLGGCFDEALCTGRCLVADVSGDLVAVSLAIPVAAPYDSAHGEAAVGIGTYVTQSHRKQGHATALYAAMAAELRALGFDTYLGGYLLGNAGVQPVLQRAGFVPYEVAVAMPLREAP